MTRSARHTQPGALTKFLWSSAYDVSRLDGIQVDLGCVASQLSTGELKMVAKPLLPVLSALLHSC